VASAILASALAAVSQLLLIATQANAAARDMTYATVLAADKLEHLRSGHPDVVTGAWDDLGPYRRRWTVAPLASAPTETVVLRVEVVRRGAAGPPLADVWTIGTRGAPGASE
jgi:hypothetical protein